MKKIEAYIKERRLDEVASKLHSIKGLTGLSVHDIKGFGRGRGSDEPDTELNGTFSWVPHVKLEIFCDDKYTQTIVDAINEGAYTGLRGDGKIYIAPVVDAIRISTKESGEKAV